MTKVLLISFFNDEAYGVRALHSTLIENGIDAYMLFFKVESLQFREDHKASRKKSFRGDIKNATEYEIELLEKFIIENKFNIIGFSLVSSHFQLYKRVYKRIRSIKGLKIVIGGWQPTLNPEISIKFTDYMCIGEGELAFSELVLRLANGKNTDQVLNFWINKKSTVIKNPVRPLIEDISTFSNPIYEDKYSYIIENDSLLNREPYFDNSRYGTFVGRGCPKQCTYCSNSYMANVVYPKSWSKIRYRSIEHVKKELVIVKQKLKNVRSINFYDEVFTPNMDFIKGLFTWYKNEISLPFYCFFFPGTCNEHKCEILKNAGLRGVWLGIQSGSMRVRREVFKRHYTNEQVLVQAKIFHKYGVSVRYDFILDNPFETFDESLESIYLMLELPQPFTLNLFSLKFFPNTEITQMALNQGIISEGELDDNQLNDQDTYFINKNEKCVRTLNDVDNIFINKLAYFISCISEDNRLTNEKAMISKLINDYKKTRNISEVEELVGKYL